MKAYSRAGTTILIVIGGLAIGYAIGHRAGPISTVPAASSIEHPTVTTNPPHPQTKAAVTAPPIRVSPSDMFGPPTDDPTPPPPTSPHIVTSPLVPEDPLQHISYTGSAVFGDETYAILMDNRSSEESTHRIGDKVEGYTLTRIDPDAITLRQGNKDRRIALLDRFNAVPMIKSAPKDIKPNPGNLTSYRDKTYQSFYFQVTGATSGTVWGSGGTYTDDSALATAAVHAGILRDGQSGVVHVTVLPGYDHYDGATSNGVTSQSYAEWQGSYRVDRL